MSLEPTVYLSCDDVCNEPSRRKNRLIPDPLALDDITIKDEADEATNAPQNLQPVEFIDVNDVKEEDDEANQACAEDPLALNNEIKTEDGDNSGCLFDGAKNTDTSSSTPDDYSLSTIFTVKKIKLIREQPTSSALSSSYTLQPAVQPSSSNVSSNSSSTVDPTDHNIQNLNSKQPKNKSTVKNCKNVNPSLNDFNVNNSVLTTLHNLKPTNNSVDSSNNLPDLRSKSRRVNVSGSENTINQNHSQEPPNDNGKSIVKEKHCRKGKPQLKKTKKNELHVNFNVVKDTEDILMRYLDKSNSNIDSSSAPNKRRNLVADSNVKTYKRRKFTLETQVQYDKGSSSRRSKNSMLTALDSEIEPEKLNEIVEKILEPECLKPFSVHNHALCQAKINGNSKFKNNCFNKNTVEIVESKKVKVNNRTLSKRGTPGSKTPNNDTDLARLKRKYQIKECYVKIEKLDLSKMNSSENQCRKSLKSKKKISYEAKLLSLQLFKEINKVSSYQSSIYSRDSGKSTRANDHSNLRNYETDVNDNFGLNDEQEIKSFSDNSHQIPLNPGRNLRKKKITCKTGDKSENQKLACDNSNSRDNQIPLNPGRNLRKKKITCKTGDKSENQESTCDNSNSNSTDNLDNLILDLNGIQGKSKISKKKRQSLRIKKGPQFKKTSRRRIIVRKNLTKRKVKKIKKKYEENDEINRNNASSSNDNNLIINDILMKAPVVVLSRDNAILEKMGNLLSDEIMSDDQDRSDNIESDIDEDQLDIDDSQYKMDEIENSEEYSSSDEDEIIDYTKDPDWSYGSVKVVKDQQEILNELQDTPSSVKTSENIKKSSSIDSDESDTDVSDDNYSMDDDVLNENDKIIGTYEHPILSVCHDHDGKLPVIRNKDVMETIKNTIILPEIGHDAMRKCLADDFMMILRNKLTEVGIKYVCTDDDKEVFVCHFCDYSTPIEKRFMKHITLHFVTYRCPYCKYNSTCATHVRRHMKFRHDVSLHYSCNICNFSCEDKLKLKEHMKEMHCEPRPYHCSHCDYKAPILHKLERHMLTHEANSKKFECTECSFKFYDKFHLKRHMNSHNVVKYDMICRICGYKGRRTANHSGTSLLHGKEDLIRHMKNVHNEKIHKCSECNYTSNELYIVRNHVKAVHNNIRDFVCHHCTSTFHNKCALKAHIQYVHMKLKAFVCHYCGKSMARKGELDHHIKWIHEITEIFKCEFCPYQTPRLPELKIHVKCRHIKNDIYKCHYCSFKAPLKRRILLHIKRKHNPMRPYFCIYCKFKTDDEIKLEEHKKLKHVKYLKFKCQLCPYMAKTFSHLKQHMKGIHDKIKDFVCFYCEWATGRKEHLMRHILKKHDFENDQVFITKSGYHRQKNYHIYTGNLLSECESVTVSEDLMNMLNPPKSLENKSSDSQTLMDTSDCNPDNQNPAGDPEINLKIRDRLPDESSCPQNKGDDCQNQSRVTKSITENNSDSDKVSRCLENLQETSNDGTQLLNEPKKMNRTGGTQNLLINETDCIQDEFLTGLKESSVETETNCFENHPNDIDTTSGSLNILGNNSKKPGENESDSTEKQLLNCLDESLSSPVIGSDTTENILPNKSKESSIETETHCSESQPNYTDATIDPQNILESNSKKPGENDSDNTEEQLLDCLNESLSSPVIESDSSGDELPSKSKESGIDTENHSSESQSNNTDATIDPQNILESNSKKHDENESDNTEKQLLNSLDESLSSPVIESDATGDELPNESKESSIDTETHSSESHSNNTDATSDSQNILGNSSKKIFENDSDNSEKQLLRHESFSSSVKNINCSDNQLVTNSELQENGLDSVTREKDNSGCLLDEPVSDIIDPQSSDYVSDYSRSEQSMSKPQIQHDRANLSLDKSQETSNNEEIGWLSGNGGVNLASSETSLESNTCNGEELLTHSKLSQETDSTVSGNDFGALLPCVNNDSSQESCTMHLANEHNPQTENSVNTLPVDFNKISSTQIHCSESSSLDYKKSSSAITCTNNSLEMYNGVSPENIHSNESTLLYSNKEHANISNNSSVADYNRISSSMYKSTYLPHDCQTKSTACNNSSAMSYNGTSSLRIHNNESSFVNYNRPTSADIHSNNSSVMNYNRTPSSSTNTNPSSFEAYNRTSSNDMYGSQSSTYYNKMPPVTHRNDSSVYHRLSSGNIHHNLSSVMEYSRTSSPGVGSNPSLTDYQRVTPSIMNSYKSSTMDYSRITTAVGQNDYSTMDYNSCAYRASSTTNNCQLSSNGGYDNPVPFRSTVSPSEQNLQNLEPSRRQFQDVSSHLYHTTAPHHSLNTPDPRHFTQNNM